MYTHREAMRPASAVRRPHPARPRVIA